MNCVFLSAVHSLILSIFMTVRTKLIPILFPLLLLTGIPAWSQQNLYTDVSQLAGINNTGGNWGVSVGDFDADGWEDLYFAVRNGPNRLYRNLGDGTFTQMAEQAGLADPRNSRAGIWMDYNNDGLPDLYVGNYEQPDRLYRNLGNGQFEDVAEEAGIRNSGKPFSVNAADIDRDGWLDIYVANFLEENVLYRNNGDGTFTDVTAAAGVGDTGKSMGALFLDYDNDGDPDLYLTHDGNEPNILYRNRGDGTFEDISATARADFAGQGMGTDIGDINNDGFPDIYITNLYDNALLLNNGNGTFTEIASDAGVNDFGMGWGTLFLDCDNDGLQDIYVVNDSYFSPYPNVLYRNLGGNRFSVTDTDGPVASMFGGYGAACFDYDADGNLDLVLSNTGSRDGNQLFRNQGLGGNWIRFRLVGRLSNRQGVGARLELHTGDGRRQTREITCGNGFASQSSIRQHFGLGTSVQVDSLVVRWPSGQVDRLFELPVDQELIIVEGQGLSDTREALAGSFLLSPNPFSGGFRLRFHLWESQEVKVELFDLSGRLVAVVHEGRLQGGDQQITWDGASSSGHDLGAGAYFVRCTGKSESRVLKVWKH